MNVMKLVTIISWLSSRLLRAYSTDLRSLALLRILVGLTVLWDLVRRLSHAKTMYTDAGVHPRSLAISGVHNDRWSLLFVSGTSEYVSAFFIIAIGATIAMVLGWRTRLATILVWIAVISVQNRFTLLSSGSDVLLRITLLWMVLLPLSDRWSLDARHRRSTAPPASTAVSWATFGLIVQIACVYGFTAFYKSGDTWHSDGTALYYALGAEHFATQTGTWLFNHLPEHGFRVLTFGTLILEWAVPILLLLPVRSGVFRTTGVMLIVALHLGILLTMNVGIFPAISIASALGVLPAFFWDRLAIPLAIKVRTILPIGYVPKTLARLLPSGKHVPAAPSASSKVGLTSGRDPHVVGFMNNTHVSLESLRRVGFHTISATVVALVLLANFASAGAISLPTSVARIHVATGTAQKWSMFAPDPMSYTLWYVLEGDLASGTNVDLLPAIVRQDLTTAEPPVWDQSDHVIVRDKYWAQLTRLDRQGSRTQQALAAYACRSWNAEHAGENRLMTVTYWRAYAMTLPDREHGKPGYREMGSWSCDALSSNRNTSFVETSREPDTFPRITAAIPKQAIRSADSHYGFGQRAHSPSRNGGAIV